MSETLETAGCFCGRSEVTARIVAARDDHSRQVFEYRTCAACRAERLTPRPSREAIGSYYPDNYASHTVRGDSPVERLKRLVYRTFYAPTDTLGAARPLLRLLLYPVRGYSVFAFHAIEPKRVFEFGAATGNDLVAFKREGWAVSGCEPSARASAVALERGVVLQNVPAEAAEIAAESVSCVLINNVLEHTHDPAAVVAKSWRALVPGGSLVIVVPNHHSWPARLFGASWPGYDAPRHLWGFTPPSLAALLTREGFTAPRVYHRFQGVWAWRATIDGRHAAQPVAAWRRRWAGELAVMLYPLGILAAILGQGDFITAVAEKRRL